MNKNMKKTVVLGAAGLMLVGGALGASAFFTDKATTANKANVGTMDMVLRDYSDLDGQYRRWFIEEWNSDHTIEVTDKTITEGQEYLTEDEKGAIRYESGYQGIYDGLKNPYDVDNPSTDIINPGDTGILAFSIENDQEKSFDAALEVVVHSSVPLTDGADEYTVDGLGTPAKSADDMTLTYRADLDTFNGSVETEDGGKEVGKEHLYVYNVDFARMAMNAFMDADFTVTANLYAKQHRNSIGGSFEYTNVIAGDSGTQYATGDPTGDWALVDSFEVTPDAYNGEDSVRTVE